MIVEQQQKKPTTFTNGEQNGNDNETNRIANVY